MRIVFMGTPEVAVPSLQQLIGNRYQVVAVYTAPDKAAGRGRSLSISPVKKAAADWQLPVVQPASFRGEETVRQLYSWQPDVIVVAAYGLILPPAVLAIPEHGCVNVHPSLLPEFRGGAPVAAAILAGKEFTGVSIMILDKGMDTGPVLARAQVSISARETTDSLTAKLSRVAAALLLEILPQWLRGEIVPQAQDGAQATYSTLFTKQDGEIDWQLPAVDIWRKVRAFYPWPGAYTRWQARQLKIIEAVPLPGTENAAVGLVVGLNETKEAAFGIATGEGVLGIRQLQLEGKRVMSATDFLRGQRQFLGTRLPSERSRSSFGE